MPDLTALEYRVLEECAGLREPSPWGAAIGQALETLLGCGLVEEWADGCFPTPAGRKALEERDALPPKD